MYRITNRTLYRNFYNRWFNKSLHKLLVISAVAWQLFIATTFSSLAQTAEINHTNCTNFVRIEGSSNINKFYFEQNLASFNFLHTSSLSHTGEHIEIMLPAKSFEASNPMMLNDFLHLIKANEHPYISIFIDFSDVKLNPIPNQEVESTIRVTLAGYEKEYHLPGTIHICQDNSLRLQGALELNIQDFNLQPPTKFMGMVKVNQKVFIKFGLIMSDNLLTKNNLD